MTGPLTARAGSQWALPNLNHQGQIAVGTTGPQQQVPDRSGHYRTGAVGTTGPQQQGPDRSVHYRASTASASKCQIAGALPDLNRKCQIASGKYGTSTARSKALPDLNSKRQIAGTLPALNRQLQITAGTAGPQPPAPDCSGRCRTLTASSRSQLDLARYTDRVSA